MRKLLPCPLIYVNEIENWLNEMSLEGKHLVKINRVFATFEEGDSADTKYAIVAHEEVNVLDAAAVINTILYNAAKKQKAFERLDKYADLGWKLVQPNISSSPKDIFLNAKLVFSVYKSTSEPDTHSRNSFDNSNLEKYVKLPKNLFTNGMILVFGIALNMFIFAVAISENTPFPDNFFYQVLRVMAVCIPMLVFAYWAFKYIRLRNVYRGKKDTYRPPFRFAHILSIIFVLASIPAIIFIRPVEYKLEWDSIYFGDIDNLVNLEIMEGEYANEMPNEMLDNYYEGYYNSVLFMPLHYEIEEETILEDNQRIWYNVEYTKSWFKGPIKLFTRRGLAYYNYGNEEEVTYIDSSYFNSVSYIYDTFSIKDKSPIVFMYLIRDYDYYRIWYGGNRTPEEIIENIENYLTANEQ